MKHLFFLLISATFLSACTDDDLNNIDNPLVGIWEYDQINFHGSEVSVCRYFLVFHSEGICTFYGGNYDDLEGVYYVEDGFVTIQAGLYSETYLYEISGDNLLFIDFTNTKMNNLFTRY